MEEQSIERNKYGILVVVKHHSERVIDIGDTIVNTLKEYKL